MKCCHLLIAGVLCYALLFDAQAQTSPPFRKLLPEKSFLFGHLPEKFGISNLLIQKLFDGPDSGTVSIPLTPDYSFEGVILEKVQKNPHVVSMNIKSTNYEGALLSLSKITYNDHSNKYIGRIVSIHYGDVILLTQDNNTLSFIRKKQSVVITE